MNISTHAEIAVHPTMKIGAKPRSALFYIVIGLIAIVVSVPAAVATSDIGIFEECFASADVCAGN